MKIISPSVEIIKQEPGWTGMLKSIERVGRVSYKSEDKITDDSAKGFVERMVNSGHWATLEFGTMYFTIPKANIVDTCPTLLGRFIDPNGFESIGVRIVTDHDYYYITTNYRVFNQFSNLAKGDPDLEKELEYLYSFLQIQPDPSHHKIRVNTHWVTSIAVSNQALRSRIFSPMQESQRYCNYSKDKFGNGITFIIPHWAYVKEFNKLTNSQKSELLDKIKSSEESWGTVMWDYLVPRSIICNKRNSYWMTVEKEYLEEIELGMLPQEARDVLDKQVKTEFYLCGYLDDWFYQPSEESTEKAGFFTLRTAESAQGDIRDLAIELKQGMEKEFGGEHFNYQINKQ